MYPTPPNGDGPHADHAATDGNSELDDMFAELAGTKATVTRAEVQAQAQRLHASLAAGAAVDRGSVPPVPAPQLVVAHNAADGALFDAYGPERVGHLVNDTGAAAAVQSIIARGGLGLTSSGLADAVTAITTRYAQIADGATPSPDEPFAEVLAALAQAAPALAALREQVGDPTLDLPTPQAAAVLRFSRVFPAFWVRLAQRCRITFNSRAADGRGGGLYEAGDGRISVSRLPATPPGAFVRLLVHETGHATFEHALLADREMPVPLNTDEVPAPESFAPLGDGVRETRNLAKSAEDVRRCQDFWDGMSADARTFHQAWRVLRARPEHLLGVDLWQDPRGHRLSTGQRRTYQAAKFGEFCAEVFMQYAMGDLHPFVSALLSDPGVAGPVKVAWRNAWHVLEAVAAPILGPRAG